MIAARILEARMLSSTLRRIVLEPADGGRFAPSAAGAHALVSWRNGDRVRRNAYSLTRLPENGRSFEIIVRRVAASRGGSAFLHEAARTGDVLDLGMPQNLFPIAKHARRHVLFSAGVGVTPFLAYLDTLTRTRVPARLHQFCRADEEQVFADLLSDHAASTTLHLRHENTSLRDLLSGHPIGTHVSICGPEGFMRDVAAAALAVGFPRGKIHRESFGAAAPGVAFYAVLARSSRRVTVDADISLLETLEQEGVDPPSLCRAGVCGQCRIGVLSGLPEHRDHVLSPEERARGDAIMTCVSRALTPELVLDL